MKLKKIINKVIGAIPIFNGYSKIDLQLIALKIAVNAVAITDISGKIQWVNDSFSSLTGYSKDEISGKNIGDLVKSGKQNEIFYKELWETILSGRIWKGVTTNKKKDGTLYVVEQIITPVHGKNGNIKNFISVEEDITKKMSLEEALIDSELRSQFAFQGAGEAIWDWDFKKGRVFCSKQWMNMFGYREGEVCDTLEEWGERIHPDDLKRCYDDIEKHFKKETDFYQNEHRVLCKDDSYKWILDTGNVVSWSNDDKPLRIIGTHTDISDRKRAEDALREKSEEMERFFTVALDLLCIADIDGNFIRVNRAWERILGYSIDELEGKSFLDFVHPDDLGLTMNSLAALSDQIPVLNFINRYRTSQGNYRFIEWRSFPSGKYIYAAARDITERINYEFELNKLAERLTLATGSAGIGIWDWNIPTNELIWDHQMFALYGMVEDPLVNVYASWRKAVHPDDREFIKSLFVEGIKSLKVFHTNFKVIWSDGELHYLEAHALVIRDENDKAVRITGVNRDVTENKKMEEKLITLSTTDPLTTAYNRRYLLQAIDSEISRVERYNAAFSLIMFDIDHFKNVNDNYGHDAGDEVLKKIVMMTQNRIRKNDVLSRWGGEEFIILLSGTNLENAAIFADKLICEVRNMVFDKSGKVTASFGVTGYRLNETSDSVLKRVDELVYLAKNEGRNCVRYK